MLSFAPAVQRLRSRLGRALPDIAAVAEIDEAEPGGRFEVPASLALPGIYDRVRRTEFADRDSALRHLRGGYAVDEAPTRVLRLRDVDLVDGTLYCAGAARPLRRMAGRRPAYRRPVEHSGAVLAESWVGNSYFGNWLADDCVTALLAESRAFPHVTTRLPAGHVAEYERRMGLAPARVTEAHFCRLEVIDDLGANPSQRARARAQRARLLRGADPAPHPGVFLLRGRSGHVRELEGELALAEMLAARRGITVIDPQREDAATLIAACAGAQVAVGVEGSQMAHALVAMGPGTAFLALQPPDRVVAGMKLMTDRRDQHYALLVGDGPPESFRIDPDELLASFDLAAEAAA